MPKAELDSGVEPVESDEPQTNWGFLDASDVFQVATVAVVGIGCAATLEAALLPGFVLGVAAMVAPKLYPKMDKVVFLLAAPVFG